jgi:FtsH-binding integral membrane protein
VMVQLFSLKVMIVLLLAGLVLAFVEGSSADRGHRRTGSGLFWASIVLCGISLGLIGGLLNWVAFSLARRSVAVSD